MARSQSVSPCRTLWDKYPAAAGIEKSMSAIMVNDRVVRNCRFTVNTSHPFRVSDGGWCPAGASSPLQAAILLVAQTVWVVATSLHRAPCYTRFGRLSSPARVIVCVPAGMVRTRSGHDHEQLRHFATTSTWVGNLVSVPSLAGRSADSKLTGLLCYHRYRQKHSEAAGGGARL